MGKRDLILDTMQLLLTEQKGAACSVGDIAKRAGIAKGGMYYYFKSKEEVFDALVERTYNGIIESCKDIVFESEKSALQKLELLYKRYRGFVVSSELDTYLHQPQNAEIHQKSLAKILTSLSPLIAQIIEQGIFHWTPEQIKRKLTLLANLIEKGLCAESGSMAFFIG